MLKQYKTLPLLQTETIPGGFPFQINSLQLMDEEDKEKQCKPHRHNYFELMWVTKGSGVLLVDLQQTDINNHQVFCIKPGQVHQLLPGEELEGFVIAFTDAFLNIGDFEFDLNCQTSFFQLFANPAGITLQSDMIADMLEIIIKMMKEFANLYPFRNQLLKRYLKIFLIYLNRQFEANAFVAARQTRDKEIVQSFINLLEKNFKEKKMVAEYAVQLSVTPNYLNEIIKKITGYPAGHHIRQRVVLEAKRMGRYSDSCMKEIAYSLGFADSAHFSKFFKTVSGSNFSDFKKGAGAVLMAV